MTDIEAIQRIASVKRRTREPDVLWLCDELEARLKPTPCPRCIKRKAAHAASMKRYRNGKKARS
jgi:hypothetical protein